jgi:3-oxoacyl-[acyl-carrier-protein] synthase II
MLGCHVTIVHDAQAPSNTITCGEASSLLAIGEAFRTIARGSADVCICGGAESKMNPMGVMRQELIGRLVAGHDESPATACRPFDASTNGMVAAEAGGLLILEELEFAKKRGARIYAEVIGFGAGTSATDWDKPDPQGLGAALAMRAALRDAGIPAAEIDVVGAFATGCNDHDAAERAAHAQVFAGRQGIPALAIKGATGNCGAGSGALDLAATLMAMHNNTLPPSPNTAGADSGGILRFAVDSPVDLRARTGLCLSYALSGQQCAAIVVRKLEG